MPNSVQTNSLSLSYCKEETLGVLPSSPIFKYVELEDLGSYGATINTVARDPISNKRMSQKGTVVGVDSSVEFSSDLTMDSFRDFSEGYMMAKWKAQVSFVPTDVTATGYTVAAGGDLPDGTLIYADGFLSDENNGLKPLAGTSTATEVKAAGLVLEATPPSTADIKIAGVQGAAGDLEIDADGNLISTVLDFTTLSIQPGQSIFIGEKDPSGAFSFAIAANSGLARVKVIATNKLTLNKKQSVFVTDDGAGKTLRLFIGSFIKNVATDHADFVENSYQFESVLTGFTTGAETQYEYSTGNMANTLALSLPLESKASASFGFIGIDTEDYVDTRKTGTWIYPKLTEAMNTSSDFVRLSLAKADETGLSTFVSSLDLNIGNNVSPEKVLAQLAAAFMNYGNLLVTGTMSLIFTDTGVIKAIRNNETVSLDFCVANKDGAIHIDIPSMTLGGGNRSYPRDKPVTVDVEGTAYEDEFFGHCIGITEYAYLP